MAVRGQCPRIGICSACRRLARPALHPEKRRTLSDWPSAGLSAATFGLLIGSIDALGHGEAFGWFLAEVAAGGLVGYLLVVRQLKLPLPLLPIDLLKIPIFTLSVSTSICSFAAQMLALVSLPFLFQADLHYSAVETGLLITPWPIAIAIAAPIAGRLADKYPAGLLGGAGLFLFAMGLLSLAFLPPNPQHFDVVWRMVLSGVRLWPVPVAQQPRNAGGRAARTQRRRERHARHHARLLGQT